MWTQSITLTTCTVFIALQIFALYIVLMYDIIICIVICYMFLLPTQLIARGHHRRFPFKTYEQRAFEEDHTSRCVELLLVCVS
jgi:hypothetical protein